MLNLTAADAAVARSPSDAARGARRERDPHRLGRRQVALPTGVAYAAAKAGLAQAARTLALEWARDQIRVNTVSPWYTRTPLVEPVLADPVKLAAIVARTPLGRVAEPREVATVGRVPRDAGRLLHHRPVICGRRRHDDPRTTLRG